MTTRIDLALPVPACAHTDFSQFLDAERLVRLHPHWHVLDISRDGNAVTAQLRDHATDQPMELRFELAFPASSQLLITCHSGAVKSIHFYVRNQRLHVAFTPRDEVLTGDAEQNLTLWLQSIRQYLRLYLKTTPYTIFFRWLMNKVLLKMNPSQRKICLMLYRFTLLEIVVILIIVIGYFAIGRS